MRALLKPLAYACKLIAIVFWLVTAWFVLLIDIGNLRATSPPTYRDAPADWGTPAYEHRTYLRIGVICALVLMSLIPNRWLVRCPVVFGGALLISLLPIAQMFNGLWPVEDIWGVLWIAVALVASLSMFSFLPVSLVCSFWRHRKGEPVGYA